jgi:archaeal preflagellin peptidase FlaK
MQLIFAAIKVSLSLGFLLYASWSDYKTREVSNRVWLYYAPIALLVSLGELLLYESTRLPYFGLSFTLTAVFALALFYTGVFGGADSKALMCIGLALPFAPEILAPFLSDGLSPISQIIYPLTIFSNAVLFAAASGIYMLFHNIFWHKKNGKNMFASNLASESLMKKFVILITSYKVTIAKLRDKWHIFPMEDIDEETSEHPFKRRLMIVPKDEGRDDVLDRLDNGIDAGKIDGYVWATPGLPMLIFVTLGLVAALLFGDVVWLLVRCFLG